MSKKSKNKAKIKRRNEKAARKAAQKARYESYMKTGTNRKSKRSQRKDGQVNVSTVSHPFGQCGNPGCMRCYGVHFKPFLKNGKPSNMPQWMWLRWNDMTKSEQTAAKK